MPSFGQRTFGGVRSKEDDKNVSPRSAVVAHNVLLRDTTIKPLLAPRLLNPGPVNTRTILRVPDTFGCCGPLQVWDKCVSVLDGFPAPQTCHEFEHLILFYDDNSKGPDRFFPCSGVTAPLVVPPPKLAVQITRVAAGVVENALYVGPDERAYTYTWVDQFGMESKPAPPSAMVKGYDDEVWALTGFDTPPANAVQMYVYRSSSAFEDGRMAGKPFSTSFQLVEEVAVPVAGNTFTDGNKLLHLAYGTLLTDDKCDPPVMDMVRATEDGIAVGFKGNDLYFSERFEPDNWPTRHRLTLPHKIVSIAVSGDFVYIGTTGTPYRVNASARVGQGGAELTLDPYPFVNQNWPCISKYAMAPTPFGAMYPTHRGLVTLQASGLARLVTRDRIDEDDWFKYAPNLAAFYEGKYIGVRAPAGKAMIFDMQGVTDGAYELGDFVTCDLSAMALHAGRDGRLYFGNGTGIYAFNEVSPSLTYTYTSKVFRLPSQVGFATAKVVADYGLPITFDLYVDRRLRYTKQVLDSEPFRLPAYGRGLDYQVRLTGTARVREFHVATSQAELAEEFAA